MTTQASVSTTTSNYELKKKILSVGGEEALEMIFDSPTPTALVQSFSEEDFYWLVQDIGEENTRVLLSRASNEQWRYIVDLLVWKHDRIDMDSVYSWFALLLAADTERFLNWCLRDEPEVLYLYLSQNIEVRIKEDDQSPSDFDSSFFTFDELFYIRILNEHYQDFLKKFLNHLAGYDLEMYQHILLNLGGVIPAALEEEGYRFRSARLAEKGFLPFEEAIGIYQYLAPDTLAEKEGKAAKDKEPSAPALTYSLSSSQGDTQFASYLNEIADPETLDRLQRELAGLCNQILSADLQVVDNRKVVKQVIQKTGGYLTIGLETLARGDRARAVRLLEKHPLNLIFRIGYGRALEQKWRAEKWLKHAWFKGLGLDLSFWDRAWEGLLNGLLKKRPLLYTGLVEQEYGEFQVADDIIQCAASLEQIEILDRLFSGLLAKGRPAQETIQGDLTWKSLLLTLWARHESGLPLVMEPITIKDLRSFFRTLWVTRGDVSSVKEEAKASFMEWLVHESELGIDRLNCCADTFAALFNELEDEYRTVRMGDMEPRLVRLFRLKGISNE